ncbi:IS110 family transposase, partial [Bacillus sp. AFS017274]
MTILTSQTVVGIDIAKAEIVVYRSDLPAIDTIK